MAVRGAWSTWMGTALQNLTDKHLLRMLRPVVQVPQAFGGSPMKVMIAQSTMDRWLDETQKVSAEERASALACDGEARGMPLRELTLFSTNDYLGLSAHPTIRKAVSDSALGVGLGPRASSLVTGHTSEHEELETKLAALKGKDAALIFPSGFAANLAVCASLAQGDVAVFSDELNHASIIDGIRLARQRDGARAGLHVFRHRDTAHLEELLQASPAQRKMVVTDSLFSMDGDYAPLVELAELRRRHGFLLVVDDAHATFVAGSSGAGGGELCGVESEIDVVVGTMSKAMGLHGGFVCCDAETKSFLVNSARALIYSTTLAGPIIEGAIAALRVNAEEGALLRGALQRNQDLFSSLTGVPVESPIVPVMLGAEAKALDASKQLLRRGFHVPAIRPPTVPKGMARLRVALSSAHSEDDVRALALALRDCGAV